MGLFERLFGKNKKEQDEKKERRALGLKDEAVLTTPKANAPKPETAKPAAKKTAETKPAVKKETVTKQETAAKPTADTTPAKKAAPKTTAPRAKAAETKAESTPKKAAPQPEAPSKEAEEAEAEKLGAMAETVEVSEGATGRFEIKKSKDGRFVFNLYAKNHVIVATSQIYSSSTSAVGGIKSVIANAPIAPIEDQTLKSYETLTFPKWEIYQDKGGQYRFRLSAPNGSCICHSQGYTNKTNCKNGIQSIIRSAKDASIDKIYLKKDGE